MNASNTSSNPSTQNLLQRSRENDPSARDELMGRYRDKLRQAVDVRMDKRLLARFDASDVVQESLIAATSRLADFDSSQGSFYMWLRRIAINRLHDMRRHHLGALKRSVHREEIDPLPDESRVLLANRLTSRTPSPSVNAQNHEQQGHILSALEAMDLRKREVLVMRYLEELPVEDISEVMEVSVRTIWRWHREAVTELGTALSERHDGSSK
jgi:RNA polymerase sigma-70 factor (subfamily 1)